MKRFLIISALLVAFAGALAAQEIVVASVTGKVELQQADGSWVAIKAGQKLLLDSVINAKLSSKLTLQIGEESVVIKAGQKGALAKLLEGKLSAKATDGLKMAAAVKKSDVTVGDKAGNTNISTASTRASEAVEDQPWAE